MSLPAAAAPIAVLVLAWHEATPAVRALVEATETATLLLDSVLVLVPAGPANEEAPILEEFFPIAPLSEPLAALPHPAPAAALPPAIIAATPQVAPTPTEALPLPLATVLPIAQLAEFFAPAELIGVATPPATAPQPPTPVAAVRVLHLSTFSLSALATLASQALPLPIWSGKAVRPAAPYVGSGEETIATENVSLQNQIADNKLANSNDLVGLLAATSSPLPLLPATEPPVLEAANVPLSYLPGEFPTPDAEAVLLAEGADLLRAEAPLATEFAAARASWPEALASLREPLSLEEPEPLSDLADEAAYYAEVAGTPGAYQVPLAPLVTPALRPASQEFGAPNLNFQVIQYARFAVPVALAQEPFAAIYAPAWPTWLAAQELRQRTGRPLVLHVATLAAGAAESVATATGWQAELQRQALHRADLILTETTALARRLCQELGLPPTLVRNVPAADAAAIAQALHTAQPRPTVSAG
ncbi:MAG: glycosyltransferase [Janthinobacterium lividum]